MKTGRHHYTNRVTLRPGINRPRSTRQRIPDEVVAHEPRTIGSAISSLWLGGTIFGLNSFASWRGTTAPRISIRTGVWLAGIIQRDPARRNRIAKEVAMEGDAKRDSLHPLTGFE